jgi:hypothetical protein
LVADHDALVVTEAGGEADWPKSLDPACPNPSDLPSLWEPLLALLCEPLPAWGCAFAVPAPSAGSCPPAIWMASPPAMAADAASDAATSLRVSVLVESLFVMRKASLAHVKKDLARR